VAKSDYKIAVIVEDDGIGFNTAILGNEKGLVGVISKTG